MITMRSISVNVQGKKGNFTILTLMNKDAKFKESTAGV